MDMDTDNLLRNPTQQTYPTITRAQSHYRPLPTFVLPKEKHYQQQYSDIYFLRLAKLKPAVERNAAEAWDGFQIAGEVVRRVDRVLDVRQGQLCWVVGTVYLDLPLKPNILDDISKDHWISAPPPREKYVSADNSQYIMLEDESGRLRLTGTPITTELLVTGCIIAVMGTENANGDFEVVDLRLPDLPPLPKRWELETSSSSSSSTGISKETPTKKSSDKNTVPSNRNPKGKLALVSGLGISGDEADHLRIDLLMEYLLGEACSPREEAGKITRLIIAGNALADATPLPSREEQSNKNGEGVPKKSTRKYGYDSSTYNAAPTAHLDSFLAQILPTLPVTLIPGATDPANVSIPQQPIHTAMFPHSRSYTTPLISRTSEMTKSEETGDSQVEPGWFDPVTNPWEGEIQGWRILATGGQPVDDIFKYIDDEENNDRMDIMELMLRWRCCAPTAPDTLWCYPFQDSEPFILETCPHVFVVGNQPRFETALVRHYSHSSDHPSTTSSPSLSKKKSRNQKNDDDDDAEMKDDNGEGRKGEGDGKDEDGKVRLISLPRFKETGEMVLLDLETLEVELVKFDVFNQ
ncbi:MAG: hypothetical protein M1823_004837 [Watsoniomyces obsoletus]|nr:MAG: hypothetical protein M1823_004837 [Watsoniomyces obsoletus]